MKNDIEKSLKRWLKNKVKITMSLVTAFLITGSIGYGETGAITIENGTEYNMSGSAEATFNDGNDFIMISKDKGSSLNIYDVNNSLKMMGMNGGIFAAIDEGKITLNNIDSLNFSVESDKNISEIEAILAKDNGKIETSNIGNFNLNVNADSSRASGLSAGENGEIILNSNENIWIAVKNTGESYGIQNDGGKISETNNGIFYIKSESENNAAYGIYNQNGEISITNNKNNNGDSSINIEVTTNNPSPSDSGGIRSERGIINLTSEGKISIGVTSEKDTITGVYSNSGSNVALVGKEGINIISNGENSVNGTRSDGESILSLSSENDIKISSISSLKTTTTSYSSAIYTGNSLTDISGKNIDIIANTDSETSYGIFNTGEKVGKTLLSSIENTTIDSNSINGNSVGIYSGFSVPDIPKSIVNIKTGGDLVIKSTSENGTSNGINLYNSDMELTSDKNIVVDSKGKGTTYGILSWNGNTINQGNKIDITSGENILISSSSDTGSSYGMYIQEEANLKTAEEGNGIIKIVSSSNQGNSYGLYSVKDKIGENNINLSGTDIIIESDTEEKQGIGVYNSEASLINIQAKNNISITASGETSQGLNLKDSKTNLTSDKNVVIDSKGKGTTYGILSWVSATKDNELSIDSNENILISSSSDTGSSFGMYIQDKAELKTTNNENGLIQITSSSNSGSSYGLYSAYSSNGNDIDLNALNIVINSNVEKENGGKSYAISTQNGSDISLISDNEIYLSATSNGAESYGIQAQAGSSTTITGDTLNIYVSGKEIDVTEEKDGTDKSSNLTVSKLYNTTQGIRLEGGALLNLEGLKNMNIISSDIAVTANNSSFTFDGTSYFEGNDYLIQGYDNEHLLVRPVIQAVDNGNINLSGNTTVISRTGTDGDVSGVKINNVGIYSQGHTDANTEGESVINIEGNLTVISGNDVLEEKYDITELSELQKLTADQFKELISNVDISLMATAGGVINVNSNDNVFLIGDILAGKENSLISVKGGNGNPNSMIVIGEVLAANGGNVGLDMSNGGYFVGRADDYFIIDEFQNTDFRNNKFSTDITSGGEVALRLGNGAIWNVIGQSYVTNLDFTEGGGVVDLTYEGNALRIKNLSGEGTFNLTLDSEHKDAGNMLYIYNVGANIPDPVSLVDNNSENKVLTQTINLTDSILSLQPGEKLRFATLGADATGKVQFIVNEVKEEGINNVSYNTENSAYDVTDKENAIYNGDQANNNKPGNDLINNSEETGFNATENWYLTRAAETINDIGKTIIEMSKANYAGAVYMDNLNKRLGDMTFANGKEGFWVRVRNDRVGEDSEYRLHNYMTQLGYDKPYPMDEGKGTEYRGIALEITTGDMEYKNINGDADIDRQALWLYDTKIYNNGFYSDYVFRAGRMESEFDIYGRETGAKAEGTYKNLFLGASAEYGYRVDLSEKTYFEPQVQLQYTYIDGTDYSTNQDTKVELDEIHSVIGRAGFRLGHDFYNDEGRKTTTLYAKADVNHEFLGEQRVEAKDLTGALDKKYENDGTWYDIGIGASKDITPDLNVYMDVERQIGRTRDDQSWQFNLGFRYVLGE